MQIPGISNLLDKGTIPDSVLLLTGPAGAGKSMLPADSSLQTVYLRDRRLLYLCQLQFN